MTTRLLRYGLAAFFTAIVTWVSPVRLVAGNCPEFAGGWPSLFGPVTAVASAGDRAFFGIDRTFAVADISNPSAPIVLGTAALPDRARDIAIAGDRVYVATEFAGLRIFDVTAPESPVELGSLQVTGSIDGVAVDGRHAYIVGWSTYLSVVDVRAPEDPVVVGTVDYPVLGPAIELRSGFAYVAGGAVLHVVDVRTPDSPVRVAGVKVPVAWSVALSGHLAYVAGGGGYGTLSKIDLSNIFNPVVIDDYVADGRANGVAVADGRVYLAAGRQLHVLPDGAAGSWSFAVPGVLDLDGEAVDVTVADGRAIVAAAGAGLVTVEAADPSSPVEVGGLAVPGTVLDVAVVGTRGYVADCNYLGDSDYRPTLPCRLRILDLSPERGVSQLGMVDLAEIPWEIDAEGERVVVLSEGGIRLIDASDPSSPIVIKVLTWQGESAGSIAMADGIAYLALQGYSTGLFVVDVHDPSLPVVVASFPGWFTDVAVSGDRTYLTAPGDRDLVVVDVSDPSAPSEIGRVEVPSTPGRIAVAGRLAFITESDDGYGLRAPRLWIYDLDDPSTPILTGTYEIDESDYESLLDVRASGGNAYLTSVRLDAGVKTVLYPSSWVRIVDVGDPSAPVGCGAYETPGDAQRLAVVDGGFYLADGWAGMELYDVSGCAGFVRPAPRVRRSSGRVAP